jgi:hypothetical protein
MTEVQSAHFLACVRNERRQALTGSSRLSRRSIRGRL